MKWAVWIPHQKAFVKTGSEVMIWDKRWAEHYAAAATTRLGPCLQHSTTGCDRCRYKVVPWNEQAQDIASGRVQP